MVSKVRGVGSASVGAPTGGGTAASASRRAPASRGSANENAFPSPEGTAVLNLSTDQFTAIRTLLIGLRNGKAQADQVRSRIFALLSGSQRRALGVAWFIISVRA
jgi:hypothetical protein